MSAICRVLFKTRRRGARTTMIISLVPPRSFYSLRYDHFTPGGTTILLAPPRPFYSWRHDHFTPGGRRDHFTPAGTAILLLTAAVTILLLPPRPFYSCHHDGFTPVSAVQQGSLPQEVKNGRGANLKCASFFYKTSQFLFKTSWNRGNRRQFFIRQVAPQASFF